MLGLIFVFGILIAGVVISTFIFTLKSARSKQDSFVSFDLDGESRTLMVPIKRIVSEIESIPLTNSGYFESLQKEAVIEAQSLRLQVRDALLVRTKLRKSLRNANLAETELAELEMKAVNATDIVTIDSVGSMIEAKKLEISHYFSAKEAVTKIDLMVMQAKATLSEMNSRLTVSAAQAKTDGEIGEESLRETLGRMHALGKTYDEVERDLAGSELKL